MTSINAETLRESASDALDHVQRAAAQLTKNGTREAGVLLDQSGKVIDSATTRAGEIAVDVGKGIMSYTKKNPLTALLLAVGAGALVISAAKSMRSQQ